MTMITHFIFTEFFITDVTEWSYHKSIYRAWSFIILFGNFKFLKISLVFFSSVYKYLCNIIIIKFFYKSNWLLRIECIVKTLYVVTKSAGVVFLILLDVALIRVCLACWQLWCEGFKISLYNKWDSHWPIVLFKRDFRSLFGKFNFDSFVWFTILMITCWWFLGNESIKTSNHTCLTCPCFDVYLYLWSNSNVVLYHLKLIKD